MASNKQYDMITARFIESLERGVVPWHKPWQTTTLNPINFTSKREYTGLLNIMLLNMSGYNAPYWMTYKNAKKLGGQVKKGEKGSMVTFWTMFEGKEIQANGKKKTIPFLKYYNLFNVEQCDGIKFEMPEQVIMNPDFDPIASADRIISGMPNKPTITHQEQRAYYSETSDKVNMPKKELFEKEAEYYGVLFHELTHSTLHPTRCNRNAGQERKAYALEELVAEIGSSFLSAEAGIFNQTADNSEAYIGAWIKALKNDSKMIVKASSMAQKATKYILDLETVETTEQSEKVA